MAIYTHLGQIPLFNTKYFAMQWGDRYGLTGYHTHQYQGRVGYMAGKTHANSKNAIQAYKEDNPINTETIDQPVSIRPVLRGRNERPVREIFVQRRQSQSPDTQTVRPAQQPQRRVVSSGVSSSVSSGGSSSGGGGGGGGY